MKVLGHDHITEDHESIALSNFFQNGEKQIAPAGRTQSRLTVITTAGDEVQISGAIISFEIPGHGGHPRVEVAFPSVTCDPSRRSGSMWWTGPHFSQRARGIGHPSILCLILNRF
jgi:hypothetical protein